MAYFLNIRSMYSRLFPVAFELLNPGASRLGSIERRRTTHLSEKQIQEFPKNYEANITELEGTKRQHFLRYQETVILSLEAKEILEKLEPEIHQFIEVNIKYLKKYRKNFEGMSYFYVRVCQQVQAIDVKKSVLKEQVLDAGTDDPITLYSLDHKQLDQIYIKEKLIKGMHLWRGDDFCLEGNLFISDELKAAWESLGQELYAVQCIEV